MQLAVHHRPLPLSRHQAAAPWAPYSLGCRPASNSGSRRTSSAPPAAAPSHLCTLASAGPFAAAAAAPDPFLPLSSIADMRRQTASDLDDFFASSPFSTMRRLDDVMEQQFAQMDPFGGSSSPFPSMRGFEDRMQQQMQDMDRQFDRAFADVDKAQQQLDAELQRSLRQLQEQQPGVRIERREEKAPGSYRYYESIQIRSGGAYTTLTPAQHTAFFNPLLLLAVVLAGAYAAVTAAFARNYDLTLYGERDRWKLLLLWPVLALTSKPFRRQFGSALRGEQVRVQEAEAGEGSNISSS